MDFFDDSFETSGQVILSRTIWYISNTPNSVIIPTVLMCWRLAEDFNEVKYYSTNRQRNSTLEQKIELLYPHTPKNFQNGSE